MFVISRKKILLFSVLLSATLFGSVAYARASGVVHGVHSASDLNAAEVSKPVAGRNRRRTSTRLPASAYPRAYSDRLNISVGSHKARINVLANDRGSHLRLRAVNSRSAHGGKVYLKNNRVIYIPPRRYVGKDSFWYTVIDQAGREHSAKVIVCVCDN